MFAKQKAHLVFLTEVLLHVGLLRATELCVHSECKKETDLGKLAPEVPTPLGSLRSRVVSAQAEVQIPNEKHREIQIFVDLESYLIENKIQEHECTSTHILL